MSRYGLRVRLLVQEINLDCGLLVVVHRGGYCFSVDPGFRVILRFATGDHFNLVFVFNVFQNVLLSRSGNRSGTDTRVRLVEPENGQITGISPDKLGFKWTSITIGDCVGSC